MTIKSIVILCVGALLVPCNDDDSSSQVDIVAF